MALPTTIKGVLLTLAATMIWSGNFIAARWFAQDIPPVTIAVLRWTCATLIVLPLARRQLKADWSVIRDHKGYYLIVSLLGVTWFNTLIYIAGHTTQALNLSLISTACTPLFMTALGCLLLKQCARLRQILGMGVAFSGVVLLLTKGDWQVLAGLHFARGDLLMLLATLFFTTYSILMARRPGPVGQLGVFAVTFPVGLVCLLPLWALEIHLDPAFALPDASVFLHHWLPLGLYLGGAASLVAFFCWNKAVECIGAAKVGIIYLSLPAFAALGALAILHEPILPIHFLSAACIIAGILIATRK